MKDLQKIYIHIFLDNGEDSIIVLWVPKNYTKEEIQMDFVERYFPNFVNFYIREEE